MIETLSVGLGVCPVVMGKRFSFFFWTYYLDLGRWLALFLLRGWVFLC